MTTLDPADLRAYARRGWDRLNHLDDRRRARQSAETKSVLMTGLYEAARRTVPGWPREEDRRDDLAHHQELCERLRRAAHVGRR